MQPHHHLGGVCSMSDLAIESTPAVAEPAREAASGEVIYITEHGERIAGIVPANLAVALEQLSADELDTLAGAMADSGLTNVAELLDDLADRARARAVRAGIEAGEPMIPWEQAKTDLGL
jgi:antitoxin (DNA-binding transcriptional repressor) of toxin-antitoxin stability system